MSNTRGGIINKKTLFLALVCVYVVMAAQVVYSLRILDFSDTDYSCTKDGRGRFDFFYRDGEGSIDMSKAKVTADGDEIKGAWYDRNGNEIGYLKKGRRGYFVSDIVQFKEDKVYVVELEYPESDGSTSTTDFEMSCPGFEFACEIFEMSLDKCYNKAGSAYLEISGSGFGEIGADLTLDFTYFLKGVSKRHDGSLEGMDVDISNVNGKYLLKIPLGYSISYAYIRGKPYGCDRTIDDFDTITYKKCTTIKTPTQTTTTQITETETDDTNEQEESAEEDVDDKDAGQIQDQKPSFFSRIVRFILSIFKRQ